jgi:MoaA/NifB/PqqE/SkfB family radical SAM enzyme
MYKLKTQVIELELTSKCTLLCPECARTMDKEETKNKWNFGELDIEIIEKLASQTPYIRTFNFCGGYGDPIYHSRLFDIIDICHRYNKSIHIETAGNLRSKEWWNKLSLILGERDSICFSVDGLKHSNHIYRINSNWDSILNAMTIMSESSCHTKWKWILFKSNQDDVLEGYKLSKKLGIKKFELVESGRITPGNEPTKSVKQILAELREYNETQGLDNYIILK